MNIFGHRNNIIFYGAGASVHSGLPIVGGATGLTNTILRAAGLSDDQIKIVSEAAMPFESIMKNVALGANISFLLEVFNTSRRNKVYDFMALAALNGIVDTFVTTNFDRCLEDALDYIGVSYVAYTSASEFVADIGAARHRQIIIVKLHGCISAKNEISVTINMIGRNRSMPGFHEAMRAILVGDPQDRIIFIGYSGSDHFDITPSFRMISESRQETKEIIYILHNNDDSIFIESPLPKILDGFRGTSFETNTDRYINVQSMKIFGTCSDTPDSLPKWKWLFNEWKSTQITSPERIATGIFMDIQNFKHAKDFLCRAISRAESGDARLALQATLVAVLAGLQKFSEAESLVEVLKSSVLLKCDHNFATAVYSNAGHLALAQGDLARAQSELLIALKHCRSCVTDVAERRLLILLNLASSYAGMANSEKVDELEKEISETLVEIGDLHGSVVHMRTKAKMFLNAGKIHDAIYTLMSAKDLAGKLGLHASEVGSIYDISEIYRLTERYEDALALDGEGIKLARKHGLRSLEGVGLGNAANSQTKLGCHADAEQNFNQALTLTDEKDRRLILRNFAVLLTDTNRSAEAASLLLHLITDCGGRADHATRHEVRHAYLNLSKAYLTLKRDDDARAAAEESANLAGALNDFASKGTALVNYSVALVNLGRIQEGWDAVHEALKYLRSTAAVNEEKVSFALSVITRLACNQQEYELRGVDVSSYLPIFSCGNSATASREYRYVQAIPRGKSSVRTKILDAMTECGIGMPTREGHYCVNCAYETKKMSGLGYCDLHDISLICYEMDGNGDYVACGNFTAKEGLPIDKYAEVHVTAATVGSYPISDTYNVVGTHHYIKIIKSGTGEVVFEPEMYMLRSVFCPTDDSTCIMLRYINKVIKFDANTGSANLIEE